MSCQHRRHLPSTQFPSTRVDTLISRLRLKSCHNNKANYKRVLCIFCEKQTESFRLWLAVGRHSCCAVQSLFEREDQNMPKPRHVCAHFDAAVAKLAFSFRPLFHFLSSTTTWQKFCANIWILAWFRQETVMFLFYFSRLPGAIWKLVNGNWNANRFSTPCRLIWGNSAQAKQIFTVYIP